MAEKIQAASITSEQMFYEYEYRVAIGRLMQQVFDVAPKRTTVKWLDYAQRISDRTEATIGNWPTDYYKEEIEWFATHFNKED